MPLCPRPGGVGSEAAAQGLISSCPDSDGSRGHCPSHFSPALDSLRALCRPSEDADGFVPGHLLCTWDSIFRTSRRLPGDGRREQTGRQSVPLRPGQPHQLFLSTSVAVLGPERHSPRPPDPWVAASEATCLLGPGSAPGLARWGPWPRSQASRWVFCSVGLGGGVKLLCRFCSWSPLDSLLGPGAL